MTQEEAKALALKDGILEEQITPSILAYYGYVCPSPTAGGGPYGPAQTPQEVKDLLTQLDAEAKANQPITVAIAQLKTLLGWAKTAGLFSLLVCLMLMTGCSSERAQQATDATEVAVRALNDQHLNFEEQFIGRYRGDETARIADLYEKAMASATTTVPQTVTRVTKVAVKAADGTDAYKDVTTQETVMTPVVPVNVATALQTQRVRLLQTMETNIIQMRAQQALICSNAANAVAYLEGLKAYFQQKQLTMDALQSAEQSLFGFLDTFIKKPATATP
jgi:hypothetical protein